MSADLYAETTARIIEVLEHGTPPWVRPWATVPDALPMNRRAAGRTGASTSRCCR